MKRIMVLLMALVGAGSLMADSLEVTPVIQSEFVFVQTIEEDAPVGAIILGEQDYGVSLTKGKTNVTGVANFHGDVDAIEVGLTKATLTQTLNDNFSLTFGYADVPFGYWTSNSVNYPLARFGGWTGLYAPVKTKALQTKVEFTKGLIVTEVAGYQANTESGFKSIAGRIKADLALVAPELSIKSDNLDETSVSVGLGFDFGKVLVNTAYFTGLNDVDNAGVYLETTVLPTDVLLVTLRGETLNTQDFSDGETQFSLSGLYLLNDHVYFGAEYNAWMEYTAMDSPLHTVTGLIGFAF